MLEAFTISHLENYQLVATYKRQKCDDCGWRPDDTEIQEGWNTPSPSDNDEEEEGLISRGSLLRHGRSSQHIKHNLQLTNQAETPKMETPVNLLDELFAMPPIQPIYGRRKNTGYMRIRRLLSTQEASPYPIRKRYILIFDDSTPSH